MLSILDNMSLKILFHSKSTESAFEELKSVVSISSSGLLEKAKLFLLNTFTVHGSLFSKAKSN